ncbi:DNA damage-binding protein 2 isoform X1 [Procambarus clarkii]|uniref:DNA damage-binding protein 2 isoform X1 n=1 Tax=Procambarus clarkii TaxID=6728 RepID=UPI001E67510F|nr:DNA damage-binding protein 2-like isoform X1 [Procambarus clarkii]
MAPRRGRKGNSRALLNVSGRDDDGDDDDDFQPNNVNLSTPVASGGRRKMVSKNNSLPNKENKPKNNKASDNKLQNNEHKNCDILENVDAERSRGGSSINFTSCHIVHYLRNITQGTKPLFQQYRALNTPVMNVSKLFRIHKTYMGFDRRTTAITWHPTIPHLVAVGSKGGDIIVWNFERDGGEPRTTIVGQGPGGSIQSLKFDGRSDGSKVYTVSIDGTLALHNFLDGEKKNFLKTGDIDHWYTSLDVSVSGGVMIVGDNKGYVNLLTIDGEKLWEERLHKQKVTHIEFCPSMPWCLVTTSVDHTLKVWDVRNMKSRTSCLVTHTHEKPINSAHFSRTDGGRLVTTDQLDEIRVYSCPSFGLSQTIPHPHRQFQHLTPIKATWHPLRDIIVVGRYPDRNFPGYVVNEPRTIDFFDASTGKILYQHIDRGYCNKIVSLNLFNHTGDRLMSAAGNIVWLWKPKFDHLDNKEVKKMDDDDLDDDDDENDGHNARKNPCHHRSANDLKIKKMKITIDKI